MSKIKVMDTTEILLDKVRSTLFDVFYDVETEFIYFTDGLDVAQIKHQNGELHIGLVLKDNSIENIFQGEEYPILQLDKAINRENYHNLDLEKFSPNAATWLKQNRKLKRVSNI